MRNVSPLSTGLPPRSMWTFSKSSSGGRLFMLEASFAVGEVGGVFRKPAQEVQGIGRRAAVDPPLRFLPVDQARRGEPRHVVGDGRLLHPGRGADLLDRDALALGAFPADDLID